jgi:hypothetical protein
MPNYGQGLQGAAGGFMAGNAVAPGIGGFIGAGIGGLAGLFGGGGTDEEMRKRYGSFYDEVSGRTAPQLGPAHQAGYSSFRENQAGLVNRLEAMARGEGPSVSREMLKEATDRNVAQQQAMAQSGQGNAALAAQQASSNATRLGAGTAQSAALGRVQEQIGATNQLGLTLYGARGADEDMNRYNTGARNQRDQFNVGAQMDMYGLNDRARLMALQGQAGGQAQPGLGSSIMGAGAGLAGFLAGQKGNRPELQTGYYANGVGQGNPNYSW